MNRIFEDYEPMSFLQSEADFKKYLHFLTDTSNKSDEEAKKRDFSTLLFITLLYFALAEKVKIPKQEAVDLWKQTCKEFQGILENTNA